MLNRRTVQCCVFGDHWYLGVLCLRTEHSHPEQDLFAQRWLADKHKSPHILLWDESGIRCLRSSASKRWLVHKLGLTGLIWTPRRHRIQPQIKSSAVKCTTDCHLSPSLPWVRCLWSLVEKLPDVLPCRDTSGSCLKQEPLELGAVKQLHLVHP